VKLVFKLGQLIKHSKKSMLVAYRSGDQLQLQALEFQPPERFKVTNENGDLVIRVHLQDSEFLALDQEQGMAEKKTI